MGIRPYKSFTFDGDSSLSHGVYLTGDGVFNAPERAVEMVEIPGRNGSYALDQGRFQNITVTYRAGMVDYSESDFATRISDVRNWLCSKVGYKRLEDDYNPNEYRMAVYLSGIEVDHEDLQTGEFDITFNCKPQRWLTSGESDVTVTNGATVTNPTLFESHPMLKLAGYGNISFNGYTIALENEVMGNILLANSSSYTASSKSIVFSKLSYEIGDTITLDSSLIHWSVNCKSGYYRYLDGTETISDNNGSFSTKYGARYSSTDCSWDTTTAPLTFTAGTSKTVTNTATATFPVGTSTLSKSNVTATCVETIKYTPNYSSTESQITISRTVTVSDSSKLSTSGYVGNSSTGNVSVDSTQSLLGNPTYIDCDLGEAYKIVSSKIVSLNSKITFGAKLPTLASGNNTVTFDNTFTSVKIMPRWWKV